MVFFYRPTTKIYFFLMYQLFGIQYAWYHFANILLHGVNGLLVYLLIRSLLTKSFGSEKLKYFPLFSSILFVVHSVNLETVVWVSAVTELIPAFFMLVALNLFVLYLTHWKNVWDGLKKKLFFVLLSLVYFLAMGGHEFAIVLPLLLIGIDIFYSNIRSWVSLVEYFKQCFARYFVFIFVAVFYLLIRYVANAHWQGGDYSYNILKLPLNIVGNLYGYVFFSLIGPWFYGVYAQSRIWTREYWTHLIVLGAVLLLVLFILRKFTIKLVSRVQDYVYLLIFIFVVGLLPFLGLGTIAERYVYFSSWSFYVLFSMGIYFVCKKIFPSQKVNREYLGVMLFFGVLFSILSYLSMGDWFEASAKVRAIVYGSCLSVDNGDEVVIPDSTNRIGRAWVFQVGYEQAVNLICVKQIDQLSF